MKLLSCNLFGVISLNWPYFLFCFGCICVACRVPALPIIAQTAYDDCIGANCKSCRTSEKMVSSNYCNDHASIRRISIVGKGDFMQFYLCARRMGPDGSPQQIEFHSVTTLGE